MSHSHDRPGGAYIPPRQPATILAALSDEDLDAAVAAAVDSPRGTVCIDEDGDLVTDGRYLVLATMTRVVSWPRFEATATTQDVVTVHVVRRYA